MTINTTTYQDVRAIALTVGEILTLKCALYDAKRANERQNYPITANEIGNVINKITAQTERWLEEADQNSLNNLRVVK